MAGVMGGSCPRMVNPCHQLLQGSLASGSWWRTFCLAACREGHPCAASRAGLSSPAGLQPAGCKLEGVGISALSRASGDGCSPRTHF